jgi:hypothetical protein
MIFILTIQGTTFFLNVIRSFNSMKDTSILLVYTEETNKFLTESCMKSGKKKIPESAICLEDHLKRFHSISELNQTIPNHPETMEADHGIFK